MSSLPEPPYYAVIFPNQRTTVQDAEYAAMADDMVALAKDQPGYLGIDSARGADGFGITCSYWKTEESILEWKQNVEHLIAQRNGIENWYESYDVLIAKVERNYSGPAGRSGGDG